jgi:hypothetical protein
LREPATKHFIIGMERPARSSGCLPVTELVADGRKLAAQFEPIAKLPRAERAPALAEVCQPYLQLVNPAARDPHTGLRLMDVWRYFRHTWLTRYRSAPSRNRDCRGFRVLPVMREGKDLPHGSKEGPPHSG